MTLRIATWNVNSIRVRADRLFAWLGSADPDVVCLQETKVVDSAFPVDAIREAGYHAVFHGQKTYNGVAILSKSEPADVIRGFGDDAEDPAARVIAASVDGVRVISAYVPNGSEVGSDKWSYKLEWLARLDRWLRGTFDAGEQLALCGDFNVAPEDRDVHDPQAWAESVLCHPLARAALTQVTSWGLTDTFRLHREEGGLYSWWDYRQLSFPQNHGLKIDHVFATEALADRCSDAWVERDERKGKQPSDHAPVMAEFE